MLVYPSDLLFKLFFKISLSPDVLVRKPRFCLHFICNKHRIQFRKQIYLETFTIINEKERVLCFVGQERHNLAIHLFEDINGYSSKVFYYKN